MGYYTEYSLEHNADSKVATEMEIYQSKNENMKCALREMQAMKWYGWEKDMVAMSLAFPNITLILEGHGEEFGDIWRVTFHNGNIVLREKGKILFEKEATQ